MTGSPLANNGEADTSADSGADKSPEAQAMALALRDSDRHYFAAGADNTPTLGGVLSVIPALSSQAGACVFHSVEPTQAVTDDWLSALARAFVAAGARRVRVYLQHTNADTRACLTRAGYRCVEEIGLAGRLAAGTDNARALTVHALTADDNRLYLNLLRAAAHTPDGHPMEHDAFAALEQTKVCAGYMQPYVHVRDGEAIALASLHQHNGFARIKNVLVHPQHRGKGIGVSLVTALVARAVEQGATCGCAFALADNSAARRMYHAQGFRPVYGQEEWVKPLDHE